MRVLFVTYCFGDDSRQTLVGVYKRGLRIALELHERGHEVLFDCTGRGTYRDDLTLLAEQRIRFVDLHLNLVENDLQRSRERARQAMSRCRLDLIVVGEAPLAGTLLEATLCAVELGIPVAVLDNAYNEHAAREFFQNHRGMVDAVVLTGPSCAHAKAPPSHLHQVPPFVTSAPTEAADLVETALGLRAERLVCVLGYDAKVERLGFSLLERLDAPDASFVFVSRRPQEAKRRAAGLPADLRTRVRVLELVPDRLLFGLIELAGLAVVKYGFMQVTECLALRTPVICAYHEGATWLNLLPKACQSFVHVADQDAADPATLTAAETLLDVRDEAMRSIHDGGFDAAAQAADFLESLPAEVPRDAWTEALATFPEKQVRAAVRASTGRRSVGVLLLRGMRIRSLEGEEVHALICRCTIQGTERLLRLWGRRYASRQRARRALRAARRSRRCVLSGSARRRVLIEPDLGHTMLPPL
jgi:hypothetical protein